MISLTQIVLFLGVTLALAPLGKKLGMPVELAYLAIGVLLGPHVLNMAGDAHSLSTIAEFGVVLFLFLIGLELQPARLIALKKPIFYLGSAQVVATGLVLSGVVYLLAQLLFAKQLHVVTALVIGFGLTMSSTAFALQLLTNKKQLNSPHGRKAFAVLLFQDIAVIPMLAVLPMLSGQHINNIDTYAVFKVLAAFALMYLAARYLLKPLFKYVAQSKVNELFTVAALFIVLASSLLMHAVGISMAMGTFLAGVLLANSVYRHQLVASIEPFKGLLLGLFFVTIGLNAPIALFLQNPHWFVLAAVGLMLIKALVIVGVARVNGSNWLTSVRLGVILAQGGEFAFVLFSAALKDNVLRASIVDPLVIVVILSIIFTPLLLWAVDKWAVPRIMKLEAPTSKKMFDDLSELSHHQPEVIIAGFGRIGQIIARVLRMRGIAFTAIDHNIKQVEFVRKHGNKVFYGHASSLNVLRAAGVEKAKVLIITISDQEEAVKTAERVRQSFNHIKVFARARDRYHYYRMVEVGADKVWRETFSASLEIASQTLQELGIPPDEVYNSVELFRSYDEHLLAKQQAIFTDEESLRQSALASHDELELLFESDLKKFNDYSR